MVHFCFPRSQAGAPTRSKRLPREEGLKGVLASPLTLGERISVVVRPYGEAGMITGAVLQHGLRLKARFVEQSLGRPGALSQMLKSDLQSVDAITGSLPPQAPSQKHIAS